MNRTQAAFISLVLVMLSSVSLSLGQSLKTPFIELGVPGDWEERPEWVADLNLPKKFAYYDRTSGTVLLIRRGEAVFKADDLKEAIEQLRRTESGLTQRPGFARFLASSFFMLPKQYVREVAYEIDAQIVMGQAARLLAYRTPGKEARRGSKTRRVWEVSKVDPDAKWFYTSQLTPGFVVGQGDLLWKRSTLPRS